MKKEPKARWLLAIIGLGLIGYGYYTAQTVQNPVKALLVFFYAVVAVIIGTYLVFMAVSITVLKIMKNNKNFYYKPKKLHQCFWFIVQNEEKCSGISEYLYIIYYGSCNYGINISIICRYGKILQ